MTHLSILIFYWFGFKVDYQEETVLGSIQGYFVLIEINVSFVTIIIISYTLYCFIIKNIHLDNIIHSPIKYYGVRLYGYYGILGFFPIIT